MLPILFAALLWGCDDTSTTAGTSSETTTGVQIFLPNGAPAASARVQIFAVGDTGSLPLSQSFTDSRGQLQVTAPKAGRYNPVIRGDSLSLLEDSLVSDGTSMSAWSDTLRTPGRVVGRVHVQAFDDPRIAWVYLMGSGLYSNVDDSGKFSFSGVAPGRYTIAFLTTKDSVYTPTFRSAQVLPDSTLDLGTVDLVYTGLPLVTGLSAKYDSFEGTLTLHWNRSMDRRVASWLVYEGVPSSPFLADTVHATPDTTWSKRFFVSGGFDSSKFDTTTKHRTLRVAAVDSNGIHGIAWTTLQVDLRSPFLREGKNISWTRLGNLPAELGTPIGFDTLGGELLAFGVGTGTAPLHIWASSDGRQWSPFDTALPISEEAVPTGYRTALPVAWNGRLFRLVLHARDSIRDCYDCGTWRSRFDTALVLARSLAGAWGTVGCLPLDSLPTAVHLVALPDGLRVMEYFTGFLQSDELMGDIKLAHLYNGASWSLDPSLVAQLSKTSILRHLSSSASGIWTRSLRPNLLGRDAFSWIRSGVAATQGNARSLPNACFDATMLDDGHSIFLIGSGCAATMRLDSTDSWHAIATVPGNTIGGQRGAAFWKGQPVALSDSGLYLGTIK